MHLQIAAWVHDGPPTSRSLQSGMASLCEASGVGQRLTPLQSPTFQAFSSLVTRRPRNIARLIGARVLGIPAPGPFVYRHMGSLATIGRKAAVADFGVFKVSGGLAWWLWGAVSHAFLIRRPQPPCCGT
jgi:hypothetical protein